jgi:hypothetical protein
VWSNTVKLDSLAACADCAFSNRSLRLLQGCNALQQLSLHASCRTQMRSTQLLHILSCLSLTG